MHNAKLIISKRIFLLFALFLIGLFFIFPKPAFAAGAQQVKVNNGQNGTMYLTTEVQPNSTSSATTTATSSTTSATNSAFTGRVTPPVGFIGNINDLINLSLRVVFIAAAVLVFAFLVMGALQWITSGGEKSKTEAARNKMIAAVIGLVIVVSSFAIMTLIVRLLGFNDLNGVLTLLQPNAPQTATASSQLRQQNLVR